MIKDNPIYLIGGGCSLKDFNFSRLKHKITIAVNKSIAFVPNTNVFITMDYSFLKKINIEEFRKMEFCKVFVANQFHLLNKDSSKTYKANTHVFYLFLHETYNITILNKL